MTSILHNPFFEALSASKHVLIAGAGGGFDIYAGLPLALALNKAGKRVSLANLSFTYLGGTDAPHFAPHVYRVGPKSTGQGGYFPEQALSAWLHQHGLPWSVYAFEKVGAKPLLAGYQALVDDLEVDAVVLVDGGTDILMFGDEAGLGTPEEDMVSLSAVSQLKVPTRLVACLGFGIDAFHGVCHVHFLENVAELEQDGAYLGAFSVPRSSDEGQAYLDAVAAAQRATPNRPSIVNGSIAAAIEGKFGDVQFTSRTAGSELFINPLMGLYFTFDLLGLVARSKYLPMLADTMSIFDVSARIRGFRKTVKPRERKVFPH